MASNRRAVWWGCRRKKRYPSFKAARPVAIEMRARGQAVSPYRCPYGCRGWHIGACPSMRTLERIARDIRGLPSRVASPE